MSEIPALKSLRKKDCCESATGHVLACITGHVPNKQKKKGNEQNSVAKDTYTLVTEHGKTMS